MCYRLGDLPAATYRLESSLDGFEPAVREVALESGQTLTIEVTLAPAQLTEGVVVTARRVEEVAQEVPIPVSVVDGELVEDAGAFNVNRLKELIPTVQFYSTNPRNSAINIRGLGRAVRPHQRRPRAWRRPLHRRRLLRASGRRRRSTSSTSSAVEVLRGPQGTLFGKNTTAGAINVTTRKPSFTPASRLRAELRRPAGSCRPRHRSPARSASKVAGAAVVLGHAARRHDLQRQDAAGRERSGQRRACGARCCSRRRTRWRSLWPADYTRQRPDGYTQVVAGVAPTLRPANRQYPQIAADLDYTAPSFNAFDRVTDVDTPLRSYQDLGGSSAERRLEARPRAG